MYIKNGIVSEVSEGLAQTQKEKFNSLVESVEFDSEESYREKLGTLKESYFPKKPVTQSEDLAEEQKEDDPNQALAKSKSKKNDAVPAGAALQDAPGWETWSKNNNLFYESGPEN